VGVKNMLGVGEGVGAGKLVELKENPNTKDPVL